MWNESLPIEKPEKPRKEERAKDWVLPVQLIICTAVLAFVLVLRFCSASLFAVLQDEYKNIVETGFSLSEEVRIARFAFSVVENVRAGIGSLADTLTPGASA